MAQPSTKALLFRQARLQAEQVWRTRLEQELSLLMAKAVQRLDRELVRPALDFSQRGAIAGSARLQTNQIRINPVLLCEHGQVFVGQILPHELAHLLVYQCNGRTAPHGKEWQGMMLEVFGLPPLRTHSFQLPEFDEQWFAYQCACQSHRLTIRRHQKVIRGARYKCRVCQHELTPVTTEC